VHNSLLIKVVCTKCSSVATHSNEFHELQLYCTHYVDLKVYIYSAMYVILIQQLISPSSVMPGFWKQHNINLFLSTVNIKTDKGMQ